MITSISNNLGISQVSFQYFAEDELMILNGKFDVDPTSAEWLGISQIEFEFSDLPISKSCCSQVYMKNSDPGGQYDKCNRGTVVKSWIKGDKLVIEKITHFDAHGPLTFYICSAYTTGGQRGQLVKDGYVTTGITNQPSQCRLDIKCLIVETGYVFGLYEFRSFYGFDRTLEQAFDITGMPSDVDIIIPIVYTDPAIDTKGSPIGEGRIQNGHFSCTLPDCISAYANSGVFFMFFAVRQTSSNDNNSDE